MVQIFAPPRDTTLQPEKEGEPRAKLRAGRASLAGFPGPRTSPPHHLVGFILFTDENGHRSD
jgi:hypothetical protein